MSRTVRAAIVCIVMAVAAVIIFRYTGDLARVRNIEIGNTSLVLGKVNKLMLTNHRSKKTEFTMHCFYKQEAGATPIFIQHVTVPANGSVDFEVNPELVDRPLPRMIANKSCEAIWKGPLGIERPAWRVYWQYSKPASKVGY